MIDWKFLDNEVYLYDGTFNGLLTIAFDCYVNKSIPSKIQTELNYLPNLLENIKIIPTDEFGVINTFIEKYNEIATVQMTEGKEIDIHDKEGGYYRTEFRLNAFKDAVAKQCKIGNATIDIINTKSAVSNGNNIRIYLSTESIDVAEEVFDVIARIVYPTLTDAELAEAHEDLRSGNSGNYFKDISFYYIKSYNELFMDNVMFAE